MKQEAKVLYHPCFGQPKVINPVIRGPKKGCLSFQMAYRRREAGKPVPPAPRKLPLLTTEEVGDKLIGEWVAEARDYLLRIEAVAKLARLDRRMAK